MLDEQLLEYVPGAVYVCDLYGVVVRYNRRAGELWGRYPTPGDPTEIYCGSHRLYRPDGTYMPHDETPMVDALQKGTSFRNLEVELEQPSGRKIWVLVNIDPLRNQTGDIVGIINCFQDITERKLADVRQKLLINELNHRVKNTLATVQAIAFHTFRDDVNVDTTNQFESRLMALSHAHDVLTREKWVGANLKEIVEKAVAPICGAGSDRIAMTGPDVYINAKLALTLAIAFHELCINAAKFGALSNSVGTVAVDWSARNEHSGRTLELLWQETGGPDVEPVVYRGFGTQMMERTLTCEHDAVVKLQYLRPGVRCEIEVPLE
jgi:two-component sensor histidine kinase